MVGSGATNVGRTGGIVGRGGCIVGTGGTGVFEGGLLVGGLGVFVDGGSGVRVRIDVLSGSGSAVEIRSSLWQSGSALSIKSSPSSSLELKQDSPAP